MFEISFSQAVAFPADSADVQAPLIKYACRWAKLRTPELILTVRSALAAITDIRGGAINDSITTSITLQPVEEVTPTYAKTQL